MADAIAKLKAAGAKVPTSQLTLLDEVSTSIEQLQAAIATLVDAADAHPEGDTLAHAKHSATSSSPP